MLLLHFICVCLFIEVDVTQIFFSDESLGDGFLNNVMNDIVEPIDFQIQYLGIVGIGLHWKDTYSSQHQLYLLQLQRLQYFAPLGEVLF